MSAEPVFDPADPGNDPTDPRNDPNLIEAAVEDLRARHARGSRSQDGDPSDTHLDVALDDEPSVGGTLVDPPPGRRVGRQPIMPIGLSTWGAINLVFRSYAAAAAQARA